jgi:hypothetical protein
VWVAARDDGCYLNFESYFRRGLYPSGKGRGRHRTCLMIGGRIMLYPIRISLLKPRSSRTKSGWSRSLRHRMRKTRSKKLFPIRRTSSTSHTPLLTVDRLSLRQSRTHPAVALESEGQALSFSPAFCRDITAKATQEQSNDAKNPLLTTIYEVRG